jgi:hypothetical protein
LRVWIRGRRRRGTSWNQIADQSSYDRNVAGGAFGYVRGRVDQSSHDRNVAGHTLGYVHGRVDQVERIETEPDRIAKPIVNYLSIFSISGAIARHVVEIPCLRILNEHRFFPLLIC